MEDVQLVFFEASWSKKHGKTWSNCIIDIISGKSLQQMFPLSTKGNQIDWFSSLFIFFRSLAPGF